MCFKIFFIVCLQELVWEICESLSPFLAYEMAHFSKRKPSLLLLRSSLLVRGLISRWLHVLSWQKNVRLSTQEGKAAAESPFSPTSLAIKFKFGNMQSIS